jgi:hypothetical protein
MSSVAMQVALNLVVYESIMEVIGYIRLQSLPYLNA